MDHLYHGYVKEPEGKWYTWLIMDNWENIWLIMDNMVDFPFHIWDNPG